MNKGIETLTILLTYLLLCLSTCRKEDLMNKGIVFSTGREQRAESRGQRAAGREQDEY
jgi:hypothetical protein